MARPKGTRGRSDATLFRALQTWLESWKSYTLDPKPWRVGVLEASAAVLAEHLTARHSSELDEEGPNGDDTSAP
jgi:hypothetical protein